MQKATQRLVIRDGYMRWAAYAAVVVVVVVVDFGPWPTEHSGRAAVGERSEWQRRTWILSSGGNTFWWSREASPVRGPPECRVSIGSLLMRSRWVLLTTTPSTQPGNFIRPPLCCELITHPSLLIRPPFRPPPTPIPAVISRHVRPSSVLHSRPAHSKT